MHISSSVAPHCLPGSFTQFVAYLGSQYMRSCSKETRCVDYQNLLFLAQPETKLEDEQVQGLTFLIMRRGISSSYRFLLSIRNHRTWSYGRLQAQQIKLGHPSGHLWESREATDWSASNQTPGESATDRSRTNCALGDKKASVRHAQEVQEKCHMRHLSQFRVLFKLNSQFLKSCALNGPFKDSKPALSSEKNERERWAALCQHPYQTTAPTELRSVYQDSQRILPTELLSWGLRALCSGDHFYGKEREREDSGWWLLFEMHCVWEPFEEQKIDLFIDLKPSMKWDMISSAKDKIEISQYYSYLEFLFFSFKWSWESYFVFPSSTVLLLHFLQNPEQW